MGEWASVFHPEKEEVYCRVSPHPPPRPSLWDAGRAKKAGKRDDGHRSEWGASRSHPPIHLVLKLTVRCGPRASCAVIKL